MVRAGASSDAHKVVLIDTGSTDGSSTPRAIIIVPRPSFYSCERPPYHIPYITPCTSEIPSALECLSSIEAIYTNGDGSFIPAPVSRLDKREIFMQGCGPSSFYARISRVRHPCQHIAVPASSAALGEKVGTEPVLIGDARPRVAPSTRFPSTLNPSSGCQAHVFMHAVTERTALAT